VLDVFCVAFCFLASSRGNAESFVLTESQLAKGLGLDKDTLETQTKSLSRYISGDSGLIKKCKNDSLSALCRIVNGIEKAKEDERKKEIVTQQLEAYQSAPRKIDIRNLDRAQRSRPGDLLDVMKGYSSNEVMSWLPKLIASEECPQNLLLASLRMYEVALPSERAQASLEVGYQRAAKCLTEANPYHEITHQRQGLLRYFWNDKVGAQKAFRLALQSDNAKSKESTLFWLGYLEKSPKVKKVYWDHLIQEYPLSFHALSAAKLMGKDPYEEYLKKALLKPQRKVSDLTAQLGVFWLEALYMYNEPKNAINLSYKLAKRFQERYSAANLLYIAALADRYGLPSEAMQLSVFLISRNGNLLNAQTLKFIYPKPFEQTFERIAIKVDPLLTLSVAKQESGFNPNARSPANARGLLQILPSTAAIYAPKSQKYLYDVDTNIELGGKILADLINRLGRTEFALAAYNAGFNRVEDWKKRYNTDDGMLFIDLIPYTETRGYVANVLRNHYWYTSLYGKSSKLLR
jgi:soluble lytic murein transglycosylase-like protein